MNLLTKLSCGVYAVSSKNNDNESCCIINTLMQVTDDMLSVTLNNSNYTTSLVKESKRLVVCVLSEKTTFDFIKHFGFQSGKDVLKFSNIKYNTSKNNIKYPKEFTIGYFELEVCKEIDLLTHTMFITKIIETQVLKEDKELTYSNYHLNVKENKAKKGYVCGICGYVLEDELTLNFICPVCNHSSIYFEKIN